MFEGLFQPMHLLVIFGIALLVFGPKKLSELGKGIGEGIRGFSGLPNDAFVVVDNSTNPTAATGAVYKVNVFRAKRWNPPNRVLRQMSSATRPFTRVLQSPAGRKICFEAA